MITQIEQSSHWYAKDGTPCYTVIGANGKERATTLRDARKLDLLPSVTTVLKVKSKPALEAWKIEQGILASLTLPRIKNESDDEFAKRVVKDSQETARTAAEWGTKIHGVCESLHKTNDLVCDEETRPYVESYAKWFAENIEAVVEVERIVVDECHGFAGKVDLIAIHKDLGRVVIDLKTQKVRDKPAFYDEFALQLEAYRLADGNFARLVSVIINSVHPDECAVKVWDNKRDYQQAFLDCLNLWKFDKKYLTH